MSWKTIKSAIRKSWQYVVGGAIVATGAAVGGPAGAVAGAAIAKVLGTKFATGASVTAGGITAVELANKARESSK